MARPSRFKRDDILDKAMQAFWRAGYNATGMAELVNLTELKPGSLYAAFHSKRELYLASLDHYGQRSVNRVEQALNDDASPLKSIRQYFIQLAKDSASAKGRNSCLLVNSVLELARQDDTVREHINVYFKKIEELFRDKLKQAQVMGELKQEKDPRAIAAFLMNNIWGMRVLGGTGPSPKRTQDIARLILSILD